MKSPLCKCLPAVLLLLAGCVKVDYVGQCFDPIPEGTPVEYYAERGEIPPGKYRIIGRANIYTSHRYDKYDIRELLIDEARKRGANAVALVGKERRLIGIYDREPGDDSGSISYPTRSDSNLTASPQTLSEFGEPTEVYGEEHFRQELDLRVLFLRDRESVEQELARRGRELDRLVKQPDPAAAPKNATPQKKDAAPKKVTPPKKEAPAKKDAAPKKVTASKGDAAPKKEDPAKKDAASQKDAPAKKETAPKKVTPPKKEAPAKKDAASQKDAAPQKVTPQKEEAPAKR